MADLFDRRINLRDGRALAYVERGHPTGVPVVYCHGVPSSEPRPTCMATLRRWPRSVFVSSCPIDRASVVLTSSPIARWSTGPRYLAQVIPGCQATFYADDAHLSVLVNHCSEIFTTIVEACHPGAANRKSLRP